MKEKARHTEGKMRATLDYRDRFLCVRIENGVEHKEWFPVHRAECAEVKALLGRAITCINQQEGIYVDEEGNVYEFANSGGTKPIAVEHPPSKKKTELEVLLAASLNGGEELQPGKDSKRARRRMGNNGRKAPRVLQVVSRVPEPASTEAPPTADTSGATSNGEPSEDSATIICIRSWPRSAAASATSRSAATTSASTTATSPPPTSPAPSATSSPHLAWS